MWTARHLVHQGTLTKIRQVQMKPCQRWEPMQALKKHVPRLHICAQTVPTPQGLVGSSRVPSQGPYSAWLWPLLAPDPSSGVHK